jgi:hypothetical protein
MDNDVRPIHRDRKSAVYLCGHGSYREPRPLDLQYLRILRYADLLGHKLGTHFQGRRAYVDPNFPRQRYFDELPALQQVCAEVRAKRYDVVFIGIAPPNHFGALNIVASVRHYLRDAGATVYNAYDDDESALADEVAERWGESSRHFAPQGDADDMVAFFPGLAASVAREASLPISRAT